MPQWVREGRGVLFLPYPAEQIAALKSPIATWMRLAIDPFYLSQIKE